MAPKKSKNKAEVVENLAKCWKKCKMLEFGVTNLVDKRLLQTHTVIQWRCAEGKDQPYEGTNEIVLFHDFVERGFAILTSDFFHGLLQHWGI